MAGIWYLKCAPVLQGLPDGAIRSLESSAIVRRYAKGAHVYAPHERGLAVMVLLEGRVKIKSTSPDGKETILGFIEAGEIFGELTLLDPERPYGDFAETTCACLVAAVSREAFLHALSQSPEATFRLTKLIGLRRMRIENRVKGLLFRSSRERLLLVLEELAEQYGESNGQGTQIRLKLSHQDLASLTGVTRETVTLSLGELQRDRLIRVDKRTITLLTGPPPTDSLASPLFDFGSVAVNGRVR